MSEADGLRDLLAAVALGAATPEEVARVEAAAAADPALAEELAGLRAAADGLALDVPQEEPPRALKARLMAEVREGAAPAESEPPRPRGRRLAWLRPWPAVAVGAATVALALAGWNIALQLDDGGSEPFVAVSAQATAEAPGARGQVVLAPDEDAAAVFLSRLPPAGQGRAYELWIVRDGSVESGGFLQPAGQGAGTALVTGVAGAERLAVTPEPPGNTAAPTAPAVVTVPLPT